MANEFINASAKRMRYYKELGEKTFEQLNDADFHFQPSSESNSIAVMIQHMVGNMLSRFTNFLTEDGEKNWRNRDDEFEVHNYSKQQLIDLWNKGWKCFLDVLESLKEEDWTKTITIRKEKLNLKNGISPKAANYRSHIWKLATVAVL